MAYVEEATHRGTSGRSTGRSLLLAAVAVAVLVSFAYQRAASNRAHIDFRNSNFFVFWLAGKLVTSGQDPYRAATWAAGQDAYGVSWRPNDTFLYPLPLAYLVAPLALLPLSSAYFAWVLISALLISLAVWLLVRRRTDPRMRPIFLPLSILLLYFGPAYLTLQIGSIGALTLLIVVLAILSWEHRLSWLAGALLALTMLKPSQGGTLLLLAGFWMLGRRDWRAMAGTGTGIAALTLLGLIGDPGWIGQFASSGQALFRQTLGAQATVWTVASVLCGGRGPCGTTLGLALSVLALGACGLALLKALPDSSPLAAFSLVIPVAAVSTVYFWSYDQILYVIPIVWIVTELWARRRSLLLPAVFAVGITLISLLALAAQAVSGKDLWSGMTTVIVLAAGTVLGFRSSEQPLTSEATKETG